MTGDSDKTIDAGDAGDAGDAPHTGKQPNGEGKHADRLVRLCDGAELFHDANKRAFATIPCEGHRETYRLRSSAFKDWLAYSFYKSHKSAPPERAIAEALSALEGRARFEGKEEAVYFRVAPGDNAIFIDLGDKDWRVLRVGPEGWAFVADSPVKFVRGQQTGALPVPEPGGSVEELRDIVNCRDDQFWLLIGFILSVYKPTGACAHLEISAPQGHGKSSLMRVLMRLLDPGSDARGLPRNEQEMAIAAQNRQVVTLDNVSKISDALSDVLCRMATGGEFAARTLYTDEDETVLPYQRPVIMNGINSLATKPDLLDRVIVMDLLPLTKREDERTLDARTDAALPRIFGAVLTLLSGALRCLPEVTEMEWPRLADTAKWVTAAEVGAGMPPGRFVRDFRVNRHSAASRALEGNEALLADLYRLVPREGNRWTGTATQLLDELTIYGPAGHTLPKAPNALSGRLNELKEPLLQVGLKVDFYKQGHESTKTIDIRRVPQPIDGIAGIAGTEDAA